MGGLGVRLRMVAGCLPADEFVKKFAAGHRGAFVGQMGPGAGGEGNTALFFARIGPGIFS